MFSFITGEGIKYLQFDLQQYACMRTQKSGQDQF